ncbi:sugar ABC transporter permease [Paenibacillus sp. MY03]|uniref:ABC transporter permease n=1 Tax=unclassified Paenibacillus TaxID=185978 RepID=UPI000B3CF247|nr:MULTISPECIES: ABC transporter permease subunit [unclassified Paenibacillus]OUS76164.1 sugar ABC transporter permease [Paenibacillus sp. MY03]QNK57901.1 sugar ABC transporter permease [Paenibacillus sp. PAMC21692]
MIEGSVPKKRPLLRQVLKNRTLYLFLLPALLYLGIFQYAPLYGLQIAFRDFVPVQGVWGSEWVGFKYFENFFNSYSFWTLLKNTLLLSLYELLVSFPFPILLALVLTYTPIPWLKKVTQTVTYAPHFISIVVLVGMLFVFLSPSSGIINIVIRAFGGTEIDFLGDPGIFRHLFVWSGVWQTAGWASIIYIAALASVSPELHEAATVDGASKLQRIWNIDIPSILPTAIILLILNVGQVMNVGFEKTFLMQTAPNLSTSEVISTYVYKIGIQGAQFSYASAIGLFNNVINFIVLIAVNKLANKTTKSGLW